MNDIKYTFFAGVFILMLGQAILVCKAQTLAPETVRYAEELMSQNKFDEALAVIENSNNVDLKNPQLLIDKGLIYYYKSDHKNALTCFDQAIEIDKANKLPYYLKGLALFELSDYPKAHESVSKALEIDTQYGAALALKCNILRESGNHPEADKCIQEVSKLKPVNKK